MLQPKEDKVVEMTTPTQSVEESQEGVKVDEKYLTQIKELQDKVTQIRLELGTIELDIANLESVKSKLKETFFKLAEEESQIAKDLEEQYGAGMLDIATGVFNKE